MGRIITYYSYKGGVGRSFLLANTATLLAKRGYKVLCIDWDLEAPGLSAYFQPYLPVGSKRSKRKPGLTDLCAAAKQGAKPGWKNAIRLCKVDGTSLDFIPASAESDENYSEKLQQINWERLYEEGFDLLLEQWKRQWRAAYDFILVDSRTGLSDIAGICTIHLPETIVLVFTPNRQSLEGGVATILRAIEKRKRYPFSGGLPFVLPVLSRLEQTVEVDLSRKWMIIVEKAIQILTDSWRPASVPVSDILAKVKIPHVARWAYGEELPVINETGRDPLTISYYLHVIASLIEKNLLNLDEVISSRG